MPRVKPRKTSPTWIDRPHVLSDRGRLELANLLGFDQAAASDKKQLRALSEIEHCLGFYPGGIRNLDNAPRAADYRAALPPLQKHAYDLFNALCNLDGSMRESLNVDGADVASLERALAHFVDACKKTLDAKATGRSIGRRRRVSAELVIQGLRQIFARHYSGGGSLSERKADEREFVVTALRDARIWIPDKLPQLLAAPLHA